MGGEKRAGSQEVCHHEVPPRVEFAQELYKSSLRIFLTKAKELVFSCSHFHPLLVKDHPRNVNMRSQMLSPFEVGTGDSKDSSPRKKAASDYGKQSPRE